MGSLLDWHRDSPDFAARVEAAKAAARRYTRDEHGDRVYELPPADAEGVIDTGPSTLSMHPVGAHAQCARRYAFDNHGAPIGVKLQRAASRAGPLDKGTLFHVGVGHHHVRLAAAQRGIDAGAYRLPEDAVRHVAARMVAESPDATLEITDWTADALDGLRAYQRAHAGRAYDVLAVEQIIFAELSHPETGAVYPVTLRLDVVKRTSRRTYVVDYKTTSRLNAQTRLRYTLAGQIQLQRLLSQSLWPGAHNLIEAVEWGSGKNPATVAALPIAETPSAQQDVVRWYTENRRLIEEGWRRSRNPWDWTPAFDEQVCVGPYGPCAYLDACGSGYDPASGLSR